MTAMRERGLRVTPQRMAIVAQLAGNTEHPTVEALFDAARVDMPAISLKTVYQTVHDLEELGEVRLLDVGTGQVRVDPNVEHRHHHVVCGSCGRVRDVEIEFPHVTLPRRYRAGVHLDAVDVNFRGICAPCASAHQAE
jgi:Fe2+ or Zn2+ uptake regulation protein